MTVTNLSGMSNIDGLGDLVLYSNTASEGVLFKFLIIAIFVITFTILREQDFEISIAISTFMSLIVAVICLFMGAIDEAWVFGLLIILALDLMYIYIKR